MFFFFLEPVLIYNWLLILAAVIPAIFLMIKVYQSDRLEPESPYLLRKMVTGGIWSAVLAGILEWIANGVLTSFVSQKDPIYNVIMYFVIVAYAEEGAKYFFLKRRSWFSQEFDCQYDGVVYAVFVALGFALWENISYVMIYGFSTALVRAVTAIPGHACFGVFMGIFYGLARGYAYLGKNIRSKFFRVLAIVVPAALHGSYDYVASLNSAEGQWIFLAFIAVLFFISFHLVSKMAKNDKYFQIDRRNYRF